jgi:hypothetical protein
MDPDLKEKLSHLNDLVQLSKIDGKESHVESSFINSVADRLGVEREELDKIKGGKIPIKFSTPTHENDVIDQYHRLIMLMGIDKMIYKEEVQFCFELGIRMGLNTNAIMEVLRKTLRKPAYIMQKDELEKIFRKYSN